MNRTDRQERLETIRALGRIAYRHLREAEIVGNATFGGEEKRLRTIEEDGLVAELLTPFGDHSLTEHSEIQIRFHGRKVFHIRWTDAGDFRAVCYETGPWEDELRGWPEPIPFD